MANRMRAGQRYSSFVAHYKTEKMLARFGLRPLPDIELIDLKCEQCGKEYAIGFVGSIGGKCLKCGGRCIMRMQFGKYKGMDVLDVPLDYLQWLEEQTFLRPEQRKDVQFEIERRIGDNSSLGKVVRPPR